VLTLVLDVDVHTRGHRAGIDVVQLLGGAQIYLLKRLLREQIMNLETTC
jgi:hypothetical protein